MVSITVLFFVLVLLAATQDIAVDGWALTLLSRRHIGCGSRLPVASAASNPGPGGKPGWKTLSCSTLTKDWICAGGRPRVKRLA